MIRATFILIACLLLCACDQSPGTTNTAASGVKQVRTNVPVDPNTGTTVEQQNIIDRLHNDNKPGAIKHLYVISAFTGDVLLYSAVKGKVTSSGKRITPTTVQVGDGKEAHRFYGYDAPGGRETSEVIQDDGTYGSSIEYIFWWDTKGVYHQQGVSGALWHVSDQPLIVGRAKITIDESK